MPQKRRGNSHSSNSHSARGLGLHPSHKLFCLLNNRHVKSNFYGYAILKLFAPLQLFDHPPPNVRRSPPNVPSPAPPNVRRPPPNIRLSPLQTFVTPLQTFIPPLQNVHQPPPNEKPNLPPPLSTPPSPPSPLPKPRQVQTHHSLISRPLRPPSPHCSPRRRTANTTQSLVSAMGTFLGETREKTLIICGGRRWRHHRWRRRTAVGGIYEICKGEEDIWVSFPRIPMYAFTSSACYVYARRNSISGE